jgi:RND family efflux transporter MFP subunit
MKTLLWALLILVTVAALAIWGTRGLLRPTVSVAVVERGEAVGVVPATVRIEAAQALTVKAEAAGRITGMPVAPGDSVEPGDIIAELDTRLLDLQINRTAANLAAHEEAAKLPSDYLSQIATARERIESLEQLSREGGASPDQLREAERALNRLETALKREAIELRVQGERLRNDLERLRLERSKHSIESPIGGVVSAVLRAPGDLATFGAPVVKVISRERLIFADISEADFGRVQKGQAARVRLRAVREATIPGKVTKLLPTADADTHRYTLILELEIPDERLVPGLSGEATLLTERREGVLLVPTRSIDDERVWVLDGSSGTVEPREIEVGVGDLFQTEVRDGLSEGDVVLTAGMEQVRPGQRVRVGSTSGGR